MSSCPSGPSFFLFQLPLGLLQAEALRYLLCFVLGKATTWLYVERFYQELSIR